MPVLTEERRNEARHEGRSDEDRQQEKLVRVFPEFTPPGQEQ